jgi:hypothetical protein
VRLAQNRVDTLAPAELDEVLVEMVDVMRRAITAIE